MRLSKREMQHLDKAVRRSKLSREGYVRTLINGYEPPEAPPMEYYDILRELRGIHQAMERLAAQNPGFDEYAQNANRLWKICDSLQTAFIPRKRE